MFWKKRASGDRKVKETMYFSFSTTCWIWQSSKNNHLPITQLRTKFQVLALNHSKENFRFLTPISWTLSPKTLHWNNWNKSLWLTEVKKSAGEQEVCVKCNMESVIVQQKYDINLMNYDICQNYVCDNW